MRPLAGFRPTWWRRLIVVSIALPALVLVALQAAWREIVDAWPELVDAWKGER